MFTTQYHIMKKIYLNIILILLNPLMLSAQLVIEGSVFDARRNEPLVGVNILAKDTKSGTHTDAKGLFSITISNTTKTLEISYLGYEPQTLVLKKGQTFYRIQLNETPIIQDEIILIGVRPPFGENAKLLKTSYASTIATYEDLNSNDGTIITPVLNNMPSVFMHSGALNTNRITIRGIGSRSLFSTTKIRAYLNDIPLTTGDGGTTIEDIDLQLMDEVQVIKGPSASLHGAGLGGTILLKPPNQTYTETGFATQFTAGAFGLLRSANELTLQAQKGWLSLKHNLTHSNGYRSNNEYDRQSFNLLGNWSVGKENRLNLSFIGSYIDLKAFIPSSLDSTNYVENPTAAAFTWEQAQGNEDYDKGLFGINGRYLFDNYTLHTSLFYSFKNAYEVRPFNILEETSNAYGARIRMEIPNYQAKFKINFGVELFLENYDWQTFESDNGNQGDALSDNAEQRHYYNIFAEANYKISNRLQLTAGLNLNETNYELTDRFNPDSTNQSGNYTFDFVVSPRIGLLYQIPMKKRTGELTIFGNISHGFSPPSLSETLTPDGQINPDIQPEKGWNYELGLRGFLNRYKNNAGFYHFYIDLTAFSMRVNDLLVAQRTSNDAYIGVNAGETLHNGLELTARYFPFLRKFYELELSINYTLADYKFTDFIDATNDFSGNQLTGVPSNVLNGTIRFSYDWKKIGLYTHMRYQFVDEMPMRDDNSIYSEAYDIANAKIGIKIKERRWRFNAFVGINNIWNEKYAAMILVNAGSFGGQSPRYYYPGLPRHYYGGIELAYQITN